MYQRDLSIIVYIWKMTIFLTICLILMPCISSSPSRAVDHPGEFFAFNNKANAEELTNRYYEKVMEGSEGETQPEQGDTVPVMVAREGYPIETYRVVTEDCYILEMHRIPYGRKSPQQQGAPRPVVYLQHGILCSSADWVMGIPEKFLGYILADNGYDVWMGNYRGNTYSRRHCDLDPDENEFWQFSWDHHGYYDIPAMIQKITTITGQDRIHYVGHSMGTTGFMVMADKRPEMKSKVIMAHFFAPVAYVEHMKSPIRLLVPFADEIKWVAENLGMGELLPASWITDLLGGMVCGSWGIHLVCESIIFILAGINPAQTNDTLLPTIMQHTPAGTSTFTLLQYAQEVADGGFHSLDYGDHNMEKWAQPGPLNYTVENVDLPVSLYWSQNDWLADPADVLSLVTRLPNIYDNYEVPYEDWNHLDYLWGTDANIYVYDQLIQNMNTSQAQEEARVNKLY